MASDGAYDHVCRASKFAKLVEVLGLRDLLPFVKTAYSSARSYVWADEEEVRHTIEQHEGGEQGDPSHAIVDQSGGYRTPTRRCGSRWKRVSVCSRSLTTFVFCHHPNERV